MALFDTVWNGKSFSNTYYPTHVSSNTSIHVAPLCAINLYVEFSSKSGKHTVFALSVGCDQMHKDTLM